MLYDEIYKKKYREELNTTLANTEQERLQDKVKEENYKIVYQ